MSQTVALKVRMSCEVCSGAVSRVLSNMEGVESFVIDMEEQKVTVKGNVQPEAVLQTVSTSGKRTAFWEEDAPAPAPAPAEAKPAEAEPEVKPAEAETEAKPTEVDTEAKPAEVVATA